jgi:catechol 2,3-dioxygenase-like lactoylglutathione lyase family enzyme
MRSNAFELSVLSALISGKVFSMINGLHAILYAKDADKVRAFLRDVLGFKSVDAGHGWMIFAAPPAELAAHPTEEGDKPHHELYLMCDDLKATMKELESKGAKCCAVTEARWGSITTIQIPGGGQLGLYQPKHPTALNLR